MANKLADIIAFSPTYITCGCGAQLTGSVYEVYKHKEVHCTKCMLDAIESKVAVLVRKVR